MDLGVVADVHGELRVEEKALDVSGGRVSEGEGPEFAGKSAGFGGVADNGLDHDGGKLRRRGAEADQGATGSAGMCAEDLFAGFGVKDALGGGDALGFATAKPETTGGVEIAAIAETVPDGGGAGSELRAES